MPKRILIVEDDAAISRLLESNLRLSGYQLICTADGCQVLELLQNQPFDLALCDIMLPEIDGFELLPHMRAQGVPVIFVSAKADVQSRVRGLRLGASELGYANILMDTASGAVTVDGNPVNLRPKEAKILELLLREQGRTVSRDLLIERVWGTDFDGDERMIDRHIASLRKALGTASQHIRAVYGKGYRLGGST